MSFEFGAVVLVPFPFTNQTASKKRPAVVVSNSAYNAARPDVVIMAITTKFRPNGFGEIWIDQWQAAGLLRPSVVKPLFATIVQTLILRQLGTLSGDDQVVLRKAIGEMLG
jgi:mRNA interferase MazF